MKTTKFEYIISLNDHLGPACLCTAYVCYYFDLELRRHNYCTMLNKIMMSSECLLWKDETCLQFKMKKHHIKFWKIFHKHSMYIQHYKCYRSYINIVFIDNILQGFHWYMDILTVGQYTLGWTYRKADESPTDRNPMDKSPKDITPNRHKP